MCYNAPEVIILEILQSILKLMDHQMKTPELFGWFHICWLALTVLATVLLCLRYQKNDPQQVRSVVLCTSVLVILLELYKQINYSFSYDTGISFDYQWYAFPFQFCSTPMYVGLLAGLLRKGRLQQALYAYLATFSVFAGLCVMIYPGDVFVGTVGINIQTMICHGSMIVIGIYLLYTGAVKLEHKTIVMATAVFACAVTLAVIMNEIAYIAGLLETEVFNMFFVSRHCDPSLPVYSQVQAVMPYPWCLSVYILVFSLASYLILLVAMAVRKISRTVRHTKKLKHSV